jgi:hypothetical protein
MADDFDLVYWDGMGKVMDKFPKTFQDWVTRHISDFNGCNCYLARFTSTDNVCNSCGKENEDTSHMTRCRHPIRTQLYNEDVSHLTSWLLFNHTPQDLADLITDYLLSRGQLLMTSFLDRSSPYYSLAETQDRLGFDNLIVGRIPKLLVQLMTPIISNLQRQGTTPTLWARKFSRELLLFTHKQWTYRNSIKNFTPSEGKTVLEHERIDQQVQSLLQLKPSQLLPHLQHLISPKTAAYLSNTTSLNKQFWIADVESALNETALVLRLKRKSCISKTFMIHAPNNKHSMWWQTLTLPSFPTHTTTTATK